MLKLVKARARVLAPRTVRVPKPEPKNAAEQAMEFLSGLKRPSNPDLWRGTQKSLWKFWEHGVTSSMLSAFLTCRQQTKLYYVDGWTPKGSPLAIEFGQCCHWILEQAYGRYLPELRRLIAEKRELRISEWVKDMVRSYQDIWSHENEDPTPRQAEQQELVYGLAETVLPVYFIRWDGDFTGTYTHGNGTTRPVTWDSLEVTFGQPYEFPDGRKTIMRGRRDGVFLDKRSKRWVFDTKCLSVINNDDILDMLPVNLQQMIYLLITTLECREEKVSPPAGCIMNVIRRPGHRRAQGEKLPHFLERVANDVRKPKRFDHFFIRYEMAITQAELWEWKKETLDPIMEEVRGWWEGRYPHYANHQNAITKYGRAGLFLPVVKKSFDNCFRRSYAFSELKEV